MSNTINQIENILFHIAVGIGIILLVIGLGYVGYIQVTEDIARRDAMQAIAEKLKRGEDVSEAEILVVKTSLDNANSKKANNRSKK